MAIGVSPSCCDGRVGQVNIKKTRRIYNELGLQLRNKHPKRRVKAKLRDDRQEAVGPNDVWTMDFVHDQLALGNKLRILTIVDTHSRFCPAVDPRFTHRGENVVQTLERVCGRVGYPRTIRVDNVSEFISRDLDLWAYANDVTLDFSRPGKPTDRASVAPSVRARWRGASSRRPTASSVPNA